GSGSWNHMYHDTAPAYSWSFYGDNVRWPPYRRHDADRQHVADESVGNGNPPSAWPARIFA
ncbi:MAG TPA: hypothetical protein VFA18_00335, partial [Gemmataceae bacterium]|nr:hypothetical protein [Gemmataceae bacterium]